MKTRVQKKVNQKLYWKRVEIISAIVSIALLALAIHLTDFSVGIRAKYVSPKEGETQFYWDYGEGFSEESSRMVKTRKGVSEIRFSKKDVKRLRTFRLDVPVNKKGMCTLSGLSVNAFGIDIYTYTGETVKSWVINKHSIETVTPAQNRTWKMQITSEGDPYFSFSGKLLKTIKKDVQKVSVAISLIWAVIIYLTEKLTIVLCAKYWKQIAAYVRGCGFDKMRPRHVFGYALITVFFIAIYIAFWMYRYFFKKFNGISFAEILFHLKMPIQGTGESVMEEILKFVQVPMIVAGVVLLIVLILLACIRIVRNNKLTMRALALGEAVFLIVTAVLAFNDFGVGDYIKLYTQRSTFIEENYVDPSSVSLTFPEKKRNLVYIYMESMESTFISTEEGGTMDKNLIPEMTKLAQQNINFSEDQLVGGAHSPHGTTWTVAGMTAQSAGIPLLLPIENNSYDKYGEFLPGSVTLGDLLNQEGYNQEIMVGSDLAFGGRKIYFEQHGDYQVWDIKTAKEKGKLDKDYQVWWGYEDQKLYSYAQEEISRLAEEDKPFNFTMLTVDTHRPSGYKCKICPDTFDERYENVMACASRQVNDFISWLRKQDFYEDTTIVIAGDHPTMDNEFIQTHYNGVKPRRVYNCIINSAVETDYVKGRQFTTLDMYPTTLTAMGVTVDGDRLGLGTNLFSGTETLAEQYGYEKIDEEFSKMSNFYNKDILGE